MTEDRDRDDFNGISRILRQKLCNYVIQEGRYGKEETSENKGDFSVSIAEASSTGDEAQQQSELQPQTPAASASAAIPSFYPITPVAQNVEASRQSKEVKTSEEEQEDKQPEEVSDD
ncbi:hypothetical protein M0R45_005498 [Rubus argutus]|uniref:Uncharacterized protein n=1 Tax=Rubus argutus TaxID=59490 RepID=A0AAW1YMV6_RUBAR